MQMILEMLCKNCSENNCNKHQEKIQKLDKTTGLEFEVHCVCAHTKSKVKEDVK